MQLNVVIKNEINVQKKWKSIEVEEFKFYMINNLIFKHNKKKTKPHNLTYQQKIDK